MGATGRYRWLPIVGMSCLALGLTMLSTVEADTPYPLLALYILAVGAGMGCIFPVVVTAVQNAVPRDTIGTATAAGLMFRQIGGSIAVALFGAMFAASLAAALGDVAGLGGTMEIGPQTLARMPPEMRGAVTEAVVSGLHPIYRIAAAMAVLGLGFALVLKEVPLVNRMVPKGE
jgi:MFS family permease